MANRSEYVTMLDWEEYGEVDRLSYDDHCHLCWPPGGTHTINPKEAKRRSRPDLLSDDEEESSVIGSSSSSSSSSLSDPD